MNKFSSYPEQQLIFENWRSHNQPKTDIDALLEGITPEQDQLIQEKLDEVLGSGIIGADKVSSRTNTLLEVLDWVLMAIGLIPGFGIIADVLSAVFLWLRGEKAMAALSIIAAIPAIGYAGVTAKGLAKAKGAKGAFQVGVGTLREMFPLFKKVLGTQWESLLKKGAKDVMGQTSETTTKLVKRYYKNNPEDAAKTLDDFYEVFMEIEKFVFRMILAALGGYVGMEFGKAAVGASGGPEGEKVSKKASAPQRKLVFSNGGVKVYQIGDQYALEADGQLESYSLKDLKQYLPKQGWLV